MLRGPEVALKAVDEIAGLEQSYLLPSVRGELLTRLGRNAEAATEFERAATMMTNDQERAELVARAAQARS